MPKLFLRVLSDAEPLADGEGYDIRAQWLLAENDGRVRGHGITDQRGLADVADPHVDWLQDPANTVVFVPSHFVLRVACEVPGRSIAQIRRALPFAVEEFVATDIESMHIAHGTIKAGEPVQCNLVSREQIENWLTCFKDIGISAGAFITDAELLSRDPNTASLLFEDDTVLIANGDEAAVMDRSNLGFTLGSLQLEQIIAVNGEPSEIELGQLENAVEVDQYPDSEAGVIDYLVHRYNQHPTYINLLQGEFKAVRKSNPNATRWRSVAALAAGWVIIAFVGMAVQGYWAEREADRLETESFAFYEGLFPRESQPVTPDQLRRRMASKLGQNASSDAQGTSAFLGLASHLANTLSADDTVTSIAYSEQRGELNVEVMLRGYDEIENLKSQLAERQIQLESTNAEQEGNKVRARFRLKYSG